MHARTAWEYAKRDVGRSSASSSAVPPLSHPRAFATPFHACMRAHAHVHVHVHARTHGARSHTCSRTHKSPVIPQGSKVLQHMLCLAAGYRLSAQSSGGEKGAGTAAGPGAGGSGAAADGAPNDLVLTPLRDPRDEAGGGGASESGADQDAEQVLQEGRAWLHSAVKAIETCVRARARILHHAQASSVLCFLLHLLAGSAAAVRAQSSGGGAGREGKGVREGAAEGDCTDFLRLCCALLGVKRKAVRKFAQGAEAASAQVLQGTGPAPALQLQLQRSLAQLLVSECGLAVARALAQALSFLCASASRTRRGGGGRRTRWRACGGLLLHTRSV